MSSTMPQNTPADNSLLQQIVLVVDARPMRQFYTSIFLLRLKYQVIMAKTAEDAMLFMGLTVPLIVIANYDLPNISGLDLLKRVKRDNRTRNVPFIIYTSNGSPEVRKACEEAGCSAFQCHPCSLEELYATIQKATRKPRRFVRLTTCLDVVVGDNRLAGSSRNDVITAISERGMFVNTTIPLAIGVKVPFTFQLPNAPGRFIGVEGEVLYNHLSMEKRHIPGMAVKYMRISNEDQDLVRDFIKRELMESISPEQAQGTPTPFSGMMGEVPCSGAGKPIPPA